MPMSKGQLIILLLLLVTHVILSIVGTRILLKSVILTTKQRRLNLILLWAIPVIWYLFVKTIYKRTPGSHEVPIKNDVSGKTFYESGLGAPGANIGNQGR
jgi:hypothetical protein